MRILCFVHLLGKLVIHELLRFVPRSFGVWRRVQFTVQSRMECARLRSARANAAKFASFPSYKQGALWKAFFEVLVIMIHSHVCILTQA